MLNVEILFSDYFKTVFLHLDNHCGTVEHFTISFFIIFQFFGKEIILVLSENNFSRT